LALGLSNAAHLLDPARIVLGGPLSALYPAVADTVQRRLASLMLQGHAVPRLHLARYGRDGAAIGAAARLRARLFALPSLDDHMPARAHLQALSQARAACQTGPSALLANFAKGPFHDQQT